MRIDPASNAIPPTIPFHVARAYGASGAGKAAPVEPVSNRIITTPVDPVQKVGPQVAPQQPADKPQVKRLVAGVVPGKVDFSADTPRPSSPASIAFYRHPADRNSAATGVQVGRSLDISG